MSDAAYWRKAYEDLVDQTGRDLNDGLGIDPRRADRPAKSGRAAPSPDPERLRAELAEMTRRRDEWRKKAEGYDAVRLALREKVGAPWPPHLSRALWTGIAADEKKRADDAEADKRRMEEALGEAVDLIRECRLADGHAARTGSEARWARALHALTSAEPRLRAALHPPISNEAGNV